MNKIYLIGNITNDIKTGATASGINYCKFSIAVNRRGNKNDTENSADFFNITAWRQLADICANNLTKGKKVAVVGSIQVRTYQAQDGTTRASADVTAEDVDFLSPKDQTSAQGNGDASNAGLLEVESADGDMPF